MRVSRVVDLSWNAPAVEKNSCRRPLSLPVGFRGSDLAVRSRYFLFLPLHTGSLPIPFTRGLLLFLQGYRCCVGAHPTPVYHIWRAHSEDRETPGIEPRTSRSPDERSTNWANRPEHIRSVSRYSEIVFFKPLTALWYVLSFNKKNFGLCVLTGSWICWSDDLLDHLLSWIDASGDELKSTKEIKSEW